MTLKERFIRWAEKRSRRMDQQDAVSSRYRKNKRYHRYFEGYTEYTQLNVNGRMKIVREYTGSYYQVALSNGLYALSRLGYILLWAVIAYCDITATITDYPYNYTWYATVPEALGFPAAFGMMLAVFSAALAERRLKIRQYRTTHTTMPIIGWIGAGVHLLTAVCMVINILVTGSSDTAGIWWGPVKMLASSVCFMAISLIERRMPYDILENPVKPRPGGIEILRNNPD